MDNIEERIKVLEAAIEEISNIETPDWTEEDILEYTKGLRAEIEALERLR